MTAVSPVELFVSDIHGEYEEFAHIVRSGCGRVRHAIERAFEDSMSVAEMDALATLVYYPERKTAFELAHTDDAQGWAHEAVSTLATLLDFMAGDGSASRVFNDIAYASSDAARSKERTEDAAGDPDAADATGGGAEDVTTGAADAATSAADATDTATNPATDAATDASVQDQSRAIVALSHAIQHACVSRLHVIGDIYDRGPSPDSIMDELIAFPEVDIQWGNHDILWMGAALGQRSCIATVVRICARYGNLSVLEKNYGIDLTPLRTFACETYADDPCVAFGLKGNPPLSEEELRITAKVQKAMAYIQFKIDAQTIADNPSFGLDARNLLHHINYEAGTMELDGMTYALTDTVFPTIDPADPYRLTSGEQAVIDSLAEAFANCERLQRHVRLFLDKGSLYKVVGDNLLLHACVPLNEDGTLKVVTLFGKELAGRALFDAIDSYVRAAYLETDPQARKRGRDLIWYLWLSPGSPLFAKSKMATFEIYLIAEKEARIEVKNPFYALLNDQNAMEGILEEFGLDPQRGRIVCGHVPVKVKNGESAIKCGGKVLTIDGGMSIPYQASSGVAGFTVVDNGTQLELYTHETFVGTDAAIATNETLHSTSCIVP